MSGKCSPDPAKTRTVSCEMSLWTSSGCIPRLHVSVNDCMKKATYLGFQHKMHLPMTTDLVHLIQEARRGCYLYGCMLRAYCQLPLDPCDCPLVCSKAQCRFFINTSLPFRLKRAADCCQDVTTLVVRALQEEGMSTLSYTVDFRGGVHGKRQEHDTATFHSAAIHPQV